MKKKLVLADKRQYFWIVLSLLSILISPNLYRYGVLNFWSLSFLNKTYDLLQDNQTIDMPPTNHPRSSLWFARNAVMVGDPDRAIQLVETLALQGNMDALVITGEALYAKEDYEGSIRTWMMAGYGRAIKDLAWAKEQEGDLEIASEGYYAFYSLNPEAGMLPLINFLFRTKQNPMLIEELLRKSIKDYPASIYLGFWLQKLGETLSQQGRWDEALEVYHESIKQNPNIAESYIGIAQVLSNEHRYAEADIWFQQAIILKQDQPWWYLHRANAARESGNIALAIDIYEESIHRFPNFTQAFYEASWAYKLEHKPDLAISAIQAAIGKSKSPSQWYFIRAGKIYEWTGDLEDAIASYNRALEINSKNKTAIQSLKRLAE